MSFNTWFHDRDDIGVTTGVRAVIIVVAALITLSDGLNNGGGSAFITATVFAVGYFWIAPYCVKKATTWNRSRNWAFIIGAMFNLVGLFFYWIYLYVRSKVKPDEE